MYKSVYHVLEVLKVCESVLLCMLPRLGMRQNSLIVNLTNNLSHVISLEFESMYQRHGDPHISVHISTQ